jgi:hypothetical protein
MRKPYTEGLAFGFIPVWIDETDDSIQAKNFLYEVLLFITANVWSFCMWLQTTFIDPEFEPDGYPVKVRVQDGD